MDDALLYFFSTVAQVLAALAALLAIYVQYKVTENKVLAIGIGRAIETRWHTDKGYEKIREKLKNEEQSYRRLRDAVARGDLIKTRHIIANCVRVEADDRQASEHGFSASLNRFDNLVNQKDQLTQLSKDAVLSSLGGIVVSLSGIASLGFNWSCIALGMFATSALFLAATLIIVGFTITKGMTDIKEWSEEEEDMTTKPASEAAPPDNASANSESTS